MQSRYPYEPSENKLAAFNKSFWLFDELSDNDVSDGWIILISKCRQILEVILTAGNDAILVVYQLNAHYNTYARDGAFRRIN